MEMRATIGIFGRRIVWAAITLGLLVLAGVRVVPARSSVSMKLADSYHLDSHCLSPYLTQEEIDEYMQQPGYFPEGPTPGYNPRATLEAVFGESIIWSYYEPVTHPVRTLDLSNVDDPDADPPVHYGDGASIRYSFVAGPLFTELQRPGRFPNNPDRGLEMIRQGMAAWSRNSGLFLTEVADPSGDIVNSPPNASDTSDIRIWGKTSDAGGFLGAGNWPRDGGDLWLNAEWTTATPSQPSTGNAGLFASANNFRMLRNGVAHEFGHRIGFYHSWPAVGSQMMESPVPDTFEGLSSSDKRAAARYYGDRYTTRGLGRVPNWTSEHAAALGDITSRSVFEPDLSTNGAGTPAGEDWFTFTLSSSRPIVITVNPTGGTYSWVNQTNDASIPIKLRNGERAGNLAITLVGPSGNINVNEGDLNGNGLGASESYSATLGAGTYQLRVYDTGPNAPDDMVVQLYDLSIRVGEALVLPRAVAGINKRVQVNTNCYFMGQFHSRTLEPGAKIVAYEWDPGEGGIVSSSSGEIFHMYTTTGTRTARLRVKDSFDSWSDWDEIQVDVVN